MAQPMKRFILYMSYPPSQADVQAAGLLQAAPATLKINLGTFTVTPDVRTSVPYPVQQGTPVLQDTHAENAFSPPGGPTLQTLQSLVQQALQKEAAQNAARSSVLSQMASFAPPDPSRPPVSGSPFPSPQQGMFMSDRANAFSERTAMDPRSMPGSSMPHASQMGAAFVPGPRPTVPPPPPQSASLMSAGVAGTPGKMGDELDSTLSPSCTIGGGQGLPGGQMNFGRQGIGFGTDIRNAGLQTAGVPNDKNASRRAMDAMFGGQRTQYNVYNGQVPDYLAHIQDGLKGKHLAADYSFADGGKVSGESVDALMQQRTANEKALQAKQRGGSIPSESDRNNTNMSDVRSLMQARASQVMPGPMAGGRPMPVEPYYDDRIPTRQQDGGGGGGGMEAAAGMMGGMMGGGGGGNPMGRNLAPGLEGIQGVDMGMGGNGGMFNGMQPMSDKLPGRGSDMGIPGRPPIGASGMIGNGAMPGVQAGMMGMGGRF